MLTNQMERDGKGILDAQGMTQEFRGVRLLPESVLIPSDPPSWRNGLPEDVDGRFPVMVEVYRDSF